MDAKIRKSASGRSAGQRPYVAPKLELLSPMGMQKHRTVDIASADSAAFDLTDANLETAQLCGIIDFSAANWKSSASNSVKLDRLGGGEEEEEEWIKSCQASILRSQVSMKRTIRRKMMQSY